MAKMDTPEFEAQVKEMMSKMDPDDGVVSYMLNEIVIMQMIELPSPVNISEAALAVMKDLFDVLELETKKMEDKIFIMTPSELQRIQRIRKLLEFIYRSFC